jgi:hypothetical protein
MQPHNFRFALFHDASDQIAGVRLVVNDEYFYPGKIHGLERETSRRRARDEPVRVQP